MLEHLLCMIWPKECPLHNPTSYAIFILHFYLSMFDTRGINLHNLLFNSYTKSLKQGDSGASHSHLFTQVHRYIGHFSLKALTYFVGIPTFNVG